MKILHTVEFYEPSVGGAQEVVRQLSERLVKLGHKVTVATTKLETRKKKKINGVMIKEFDIAGNAVKGYRGKEEERRRYKEMLVSDEYDVVMNYAAQQWSADLAYEVLDRMDAKKVLVPCGFSGLPRDSYREYFKQMPEVLGKYDACVYLSETYQDIEFARKNGVKNDVLIPNGAGEDEFENDSGPDIRKKLGVSEDNFLVLTVGSHTGDKGHKEAIEIFLKSRLRDATLLVVGNSLGRGCAGACKRSEMFSQLNPANIIAHKKVRVVDWPREKVVAAFQQADVFLFPSNIECSPLVLFEAMAGKTAFFVTDVGNAKEIVKWSGGGKLMPTKRDKRHRAVAKIAEAAGMLSELYLDEDQRNQLAENGYISWKKKFTWEKIVGQYEELYQSLISK